MLGMNKAPVNTMETSDGKIYVFHIPTEKMNKF